MPEKTDTLKPERESEPVPDWPARRKEAREALQRLRRIGESLPVVDAVAIVREGRDASEQDTR